VGLIEIARGANVSLQTIYKYYGSKEPLLFASLDAWLDKLAARMIDHLQGLSDYKEKLRKVFWVGNRDFKRPFSPRGRVELGS
jgi:TetR/AcrR family transcriptional regulator, repressor of fatR-cypB operon